MTAPWLFLTPAALAVGVATHKRLAESLALGFPLISGPGGQTQSQCGSERSAFFIDTKGIVRLIVKGLPDNRRLLADLERLLA